MTRLVSIAAAVLASASLAAQQIPATGPRQGTAQGAVPPIAPQGSAPAAGQLPEVEMGAVPIEQEPRHRLVFSNEFVRIIDAQFPPLYVSQRHTHAYDNVAVLIQAGQSGPIRAGFVSFARGGYSHTITNPNLQAMRFIDVELRAADFGEAADPGPLAGHELVLSNGRVHVSRVTLEPGTRVEPHRHQFGYVSVVVRGAEGAGSWRWHPSTEAGTALVANRQALEVVEIEPR